MAKDVLIENPDEQSAYKYIPGTTQEAKPAVVDEQPGETFTKEQVDQMFGPEDQQTGNGDELVSVIGPDNLPKVVPANMVAPGTQVATPQQPSETTVADGGGTTDVTDQDKITATNNTGQQGQVTAQTTKQPTDAATNTTDQAKVVTTPKTHMYNWGGEGVTLYDVLHGDGKDKPISQVVNDYYAWAGENGITPNVLDIMEAMKDKDVSKSTAQNELDEKKRKRKETWDKVGLFLTHLGNAIGTFAGGGHMPIKTEDPVKWTERQKRLRDETLAQRNAYNKSYLDMMYKQNADQRKADMEKQQLEMRKAEQEQKAKLSALNEELTRARINGENKKADKIQAEIDRIKELTPYEIEYKKSQTYQKMQSGKSGKTSSRGGGKGKTSNGTTSTTYDGEGNVKSVTVREPNANKPSGTQKRTSKTRL